VKKIEFARRGNFSRAPELFGKLPIFDFKLLERFELADIEISGRASRLLLLDRGTHAANDFEAPAWRCRAP
jgi:hypothetical protein